MSAKNQMLLIQPMMFIDDSNRVEIMKSESHTCPSCNGSGWHWGEDPFGERIKKPCVACKGKGKLDAKITIEWVPAE